MCLAHLGVDIMEQLYVEAILLTLRPLAGKDQLVVQDADVGVLAVHHLHGEEDLSLSLVPAAVGSESPAMDCPQSSDQLITKYLIHHLCLDKYGQSDPSGDVLVMAGY